MDGTLLEEEADKELLEKSFHDVLESGEIAVAWVICLFFNDLHVTEIVSHHHERGARVTAAHGEGDDGSGEESGFHQAFSEEHSEGEPRVVDVVAF
jgi:hypothetical protein